MFEWEWLFINKILERGRAINSTAILNLTINDDGLIATVLGTESYTVHIDKELDWISCTCPFASQNPVMCKHVAAILFYLEESKNEELVSFYKKLSQSPLAKKSLESKEKNQVREEVHQIKEKEKSEKERITVEKMAEWWRTLPERKAAEEEKKRLTKEKRKEREKKALNKQIREEERLQRILEKIKEEEKKRKEQEVQWKKNLAEQERLWQEQKKKRIEEEKRRQIKLEINEVEERKKAEEERQRKLDREVERKKKKLHKKFQDYFAEQDELLAQLERENQELDWSGTPYSMEMERLKKTGWYYSDEDEIDGKTSIEKNGKRIFVPDGFHLTEKE